MVVTIDIKISIDIHFSVIRPIDAAESFEI